MKNTKIVNFENGIQIIETDVPFEAIKQFVDNYGKNAPAESTETNAEKYMRENHPVFYNKGKEMGALDDAQFKGLEMAAVDLGTPVEEIIDTCVRTAETPMWPLVAQFMSACRAKYITENE